MVLRVQADSSEGVLPPWWRLVSVSDSAGLQVVAPDSLTACQVDTARVSAVDVPTTPADSAANQTTAHFCSSRSIRATVAFSTIDLPAGRRGRLKVVALSPAGPDSVIESNEVVYNGGVEDLPADNSSALVVVSATSDTILYRDPDPGVYPHDFAFYYNSVPDPTNPAHPWKGAFHLF